MLLHYLQHALGRCISGESEHGGGGGGGGGYQMRDGGGSVAAAGEAGEGAVFHAVGGLGPWWSG